jgi:hypothetical protein
VALPPRIPGRPGQQLRPGQQPTVDDTIASRRANDQLADDCKEVEEDLEELKARYEQFFLGIERREPARERWEMKRRVEKLKEAFTRNTGLKFRLQTLHARFLSYERMWVRSAREKEAGTYRRDLFKARLHRKEEAQKPAPEAAAPAPVQRSPVAPPAAAPARPAALPGTSEPELRALYSAYVDAKKRCREDVSKLSYDALAKSVQKQVPELMAKFKARTIEFRIEVKDGKAVLKAIPRV